MSEADYKKSTNEDLCWLKSATEEQVDDNPNKELLLVARKYDFIKVRKILSEESTDLQLLMDDNLRTGAHYAAMHQDGEEALAEIVQRFGTACLVSPDVDKITPLHLSACYHSAQSWEKNFQGVPSVRLYQLRDSNGNTCAHWAAQNSKDCTMVLTVNNQASGICWKLRNNGHETVFHHVLQYCQDRNVLKNILDCIAKTSGILGEKDAAGNTAAHFAAKSKIDAIEYVQEKWMKRQNNWLVSTNRKKETVLHLALMHCSEELAKRLLEQYYLPPHWCELRDNQGNTSLHVLAQCQGRDAVLLKAVEVASRQSQKQSFQNQDLEARQVQAQRLRPRKQDMSKAPGFLSTDLPGIQSAKFVDESSYLLAQNKRKSTVLHYAVENCQLETVKELLAKIKKFRHLLIADKAGNTILHIAAKRKDKAKMFNLLIEKFETKMERQLVKIISKRNNKNQSVLHLAIDVFDSADSENYPEATKENFKKLSIENLLKAMSEQEQEQELKLVDKAGNTLLHSLMQSQLTYDGVEQHILDRFKLLVSMGVDVKAVNNLNLNCLHATKLDASVLCKLLSKEEAATLFEVLLVNSATGAHIIHTFSGQYDLQQLSSLQGGQTMLDVIAKVSKTHKDILIKKRVNPQSCENAEHGETCLHFACAYGHQENIHFLLWSGLSLWSESHAGQTCVDYAYENGNFYDLVQAVRGYNDACRFNNDQNSSAEVSSDLIDVPTTHKEIRMVDVLCLLDPPQRALALPDRQAARTTLVSITNDYGTTRRQKQFTRGADTKKQKTDKMVLIRALEMDSKKIFRAALSLNMLTNATEALFTEYFIETLITEEDIRKAFSRQNMFKNMPHVDAATSELALIDLAAFFYRDEILPDLILTRQFELIPCCLSLLIQLGPEIIKMRAKAKGKHEQLLQLQKKVTNIAMNALNELFINANSIESELLFKYIRGEMKNLQLSSENGAAAECNKSSGPKFPYRVSDGYNDQIKYGSVLDLVKQADNPDLFATDCIYSLTKEEWRKPIYECSREQTNSQSCCASLCSFSYRPKISKPESPKAKFWIHTVAFVVFLGFFGWYILNFQRSFPLPEVDALLVAYLLSFGLQEATKIWRQRKARENCKIGSHVWCVPAYMVDWLNIFDLLAIVLMLVGLIARWFYYGMGFKVEDAYPSQMILSTSFSLFCFRSVSLLSYFEAVGPMINMLSSLIFYDLLPFLTILFVIFSCFGVFFTCLLFSFAWNPEAHVGNPYNGWQMFIQAATLPFNLLFGNFDLIEFTYSPDSTKLGKVAIKEGYEWFYHLLVFIFMGLVNVVMMNLLIALFNLRVTQIYGVATGIWRKRYFQMLQEYQTLTTIPPPFSFLKYIFNILQFVFSHCCKGCGAKNSISNENNFDADNANTSDCWWQDKRSYTAEYNRFLEFQAIQFRRCRSRLLRDTQWNRNDFDVVKAHAANELSDLKSELLEMLEEAKQHGKNSYRKQDSLSQASTMEPEPRVPRKLSDTDNNQKLLKELKEQYRKIEDKMHRQRRRMKGMESKLDQLLALVNQQPHHLSK
ncbi:hypothetical protein BOX15_Mlig015346g1 [Macrostomum lignano]|uniref:ANK_REP_REGION domain-containing protein n=1 Tax=Macrostomum lignano TaxID=282301 RepID=A0A267H4W2_9PLAT|nr:hypothetical protein BOX15_Mlig015346g1 [Macrostomum lignano]